jgi:O-antigen/teichoic acid export membrane protein
MLGRSRVVPRGAVGRLTGSSVMRQASIFTGANIVVGLLALVSTTIVTRSLTSTEFGNYAFALNVLGLAAMFFEFGIFSAAARIAASRPVEQRREVVGASLIAYVPVGVAFSAFVVGFSFVADSLFNVHPGSALRASAIVAVAIPFGFVLGQLAQGVDRLHVSSITGVLAQGLIVALFASLAAAGRLESTSGLVARCFALLVTGVVACVWLRPVFTRTRAWLRTVLRETRVYGFHVYVGRLLSIGTYNIDVLMLGYWATAGDVGRYVLAGALAAAAGLPVLGLSSTLFARMANEARIERRWIVAATLVSVLLSLAAWLVAGPFIRFVFPASYDAAIGLVLPLAMAQAVRGVTGVYNTFLSAHGSGRELRNAGLVLTVSNVVLNFALIPPYGAMGAAWASLFALVANLAAHVFWYRRTTLTPA